MQVASAGPVVLGAVHSPVLCKALFDLYLGDMPVSKRAKVSKAGCVCKHNQSASITNPAGGTGLHDVSCLVGHHASQAQAAIVSE